MTPRNLSCPGCCPGHPARPPSCCCWAPRAWPRPRATVRCCPTTRTSPCRRRREEPVEQPAPASDLVTTDGISWVEWLGYGALVLVSLGLTVVALTTLWWMLHAWRSTDSLKATALLQQPGRAADAPSRCWSRPATRRRSWATPSTSSRPRTTPTSRSSRSSATTTRGPRPSPAPRRPATPSVISVVIDDTVPKNKPRGMNTALPHARGDIVGVFDAEDEVHPAPAAARGLAVQRDRRRRGPGRRAADERPARSWWALRNCLEYYFWFRCRLHFHAERPLHPARRQHRLRPHRPAPRGRRLGRRLPRRGLRARRPPLDPGRHGRGGLRPRGRHPRGDAGIAHQRCSSSAPAGARASCRSSRRATGSSCRRAVSAGWPATRSSMPFLQAFTGLMIPVSVALVLFAKVPVLIAMITFLPARCRRWSPWPSRPPGSESSAAPTA